jgi:hypothetical protein
MPFLGWGLSLAWLPRAATEPAAPPRTIPITAPSAGEADDATRRLLTDADEPSSHWESRPTATPETSSSLGWSAWALIAWLAVVLVQSCD